jgi:uncharacterized membrane protein SpoIIM required for sporulation
MRETDFINQNKAKWKEFEKQLKVSKKDPEKLGRLFIETTDDLSYSRTFYPNRSVRVYLNSIAQQVFLSIYRNKKSKGSKILNFWRTALPEAMWENRKQLLLAFVIFFAGLAIGLVSGIYDPDYISQMFGGIDVDDFMDYYKNPEPFQWFLELAWNNIRISFLTFVLGIVFGFGAAFIVFYNAIRLGVFFAFFIAKGLFWESFYTVMLHGTLELSMIVLAGCAGLALARGIIAPGSYPRLQALVMSARSGIKIMLGVSALLLVAAFIEAFVTRHMDAPNLLRGSLILVSLIIVVGYFVIYPRVRYKQGAFEKKKHDDLQPNRDYNILYTEIKKSGKIFTEVFSYFRNHMKLLGYASGILAMLAIVQMSFSLDHGFGNYVFDSGYDSYFSNIFLMFVDILWVWNEVNNFFTFSEVPSLVPFFILATATMLTVSNIAFERDRQDGKTTRFLRAKQLLNAIICSGILMVSLTVDSEWSIVVNLVLWPLTLMTYAVASREHLHFFSGIARMFQLLRKGGGRLFGVFATCSVIPWIVLISCSGYLWEFIADIIALSYPSEWPMAAELPAIVYTVYTLFLLAFTFPLMIFGLNLLYYTLLEISEANSLKERVQKIGFRKKAYGLEREV